MTETQVFGPAMPCRWLLRFTAFLFGGVAYLTFLFTILYAIGFVSGLDVPKAIDTGLESGMLEAIAVNLVLISLFAIQHSAMTRRSFKHRGAPVIPEYAERGAYMLCASLALLLLFWQWRPIPTVIWDVEDPDVTMAIVTLAFVGWVMVFLSVFQMNHVKALGTQQPAFRTPVFRRLFRHPIYPGLIAACWAAPTMSAGHLLFAAATTAYIFLGLALAGRDPAGILGSEYRRLRQRVLKRSPGGGRTHHC